MKLAKYLLGTLFIVLLCSGCSVAKKEQSFLFSDSCVEETYSYSRQATTTTAVITTETTTETTTTTTTTTTTMETTTASSSTEVTVITEVITPPETDSPEETYSEPIEMTECSEAVYQYDISEVDRVMLCNLVAHEYGSDWVPVSEKAKVVAVVMNRVNSDLFPNTIYEVLTQPNQFSGYIAQDSYTSKVTDSVVESVDYYFNHVSEFGSYLYFEGDGTYNYFH